MACYILDTCQSSLSLLFFAKSNDVIHKKKNLFSVLWNAMITKQLKLSFSIGMIFCKGMSICFVCLLDIKVDISVWIGQWMH